MNSCQRAGKNADDPQGIPSISGAGANLGTALSGSIGTPPSVTGCGTGATDRNRSCTSSRESSGLPDSNQPLGTRQVVGSVSTANVSYGTGSKGQGRSDGRHEERKSVADTDSRLTSRGGTTRLRSGGKVGGDDNVTSTTGTGPKGPPASPAGYLRTTTPISTLRFGQSIRSAGKSER